MRNNLKIISAFLPIILCVSSCSNEASFADELAKRLSSLSSVLEVKKLEMAECSYKGAYQVFFSVPLDWNNPEGEKIRQRVVVEANAFDNATACELQGYSISDKYVISGFTRELPKLLNSNFVVIEHRFFSESSYSKANYEDASGWEQLTVKNAAHDHNFIISELRKVLTGKWVASGSSKGGYITNCLACLYPSTCDAYVPYVAPCLSQYDKRPFEFIYNEAGNSTYGKEKGKEIRDNLLKFEIFCLEHKEALMDELFSEKYLPTTSLFRASLSKEQLFDINLLDFSYGFWQYGYTDAQTINSFVNLAETSQAEINAKIEKALEILDKGGGKMDNVSYNSKTYPYYITAHKEMGNYTYDSSYIKNMAKSLGKEIKFSIDDDKFIDVANRVYLSEDQIKNIEYDDTMYHTLNNWIKDEKIETKIIMLNGEEDPWYHGGLIWPEKFAKNVKVYTHPSKNHRVQITDFDTPIKNEILSTLNDWLK